MLAHGDQVHANVPVAGTAPARSFQVVIDFLALDATLHSGSQRVTLSPFLAVTADAREQARVIRGGCVERSSIIGRRAGSRAFPFADFGGTAPFDALSPGTLAPADHLASNGADRNAIGANFHFIVYRMPGTPEIQVDDGGNIIMFQHGIDREGVVGRIQERLSHLPVRVPVTQLAVAADP